jgi:D-methionine transport system permease protein
VIDPNAPGFWPTLLQGLLTATGQTLYMLFFTAVFTFVLGLLLGIVLVTTDKGGLFERPFGSRALGAGINVVLGTIVNIGRSVPFIILMVALIPVARAIVGSAFSIQGAIVPLVIAAVPFFARIVEIALREVPSGLLEAGSSLGASRWQLVFKVLVPEAVPGLIRGFTTAVVTIINYSAIVTVLGNYGLGSFAYINGYQRYSVIHILIVIAVLVVLVQGLQSIGNLLARRLSHR